VLSGRNAESMIRRSIPAARVICELRAFRTASNSTVSSCFLPRSFARWTAPCPHLPHLIKLVWDRKIDPGKVFDLKLPLDKCEGYRAMDERRAIKTCGLRSRFAVEAVSDIKTSSSMQGVKEWRSKSWLELCEGPSEWFTGTVRIDPFFRHPPALFKG